MKIKTLHIYNIASIVDATIDFTAEPLSSSDVFLITGDTGAGKTTILDSICLALFNNTPRLDKGKLTKVKNGIDDLTLKDPRRLMRRDTGEAMVELYFEAGGIEYEVEWHVQRGKNKKPNVSLDNVSRKFTNLSTNQSITGAGTRDKDLQAKIQEVIGLDFDQFCRTTMLAQNEFTKFLSSDEDKRAEILEKITKTTEFSAVGAKVYEICTAKEINWKNAQKLASDTGLSDEEIQQKKDQKTELDQQVKQQKAERDSADKKRNWLKRETELVESEQNAKTAYDDASKAVESDDYKKKCQFVEQWNLTIQARQWLHQQIEANKTIADKNEKLSEQETAFLSVLNGQQFNLDELETLKAELAQIDNYLRENIQKAATFQNAQTIIGYLDTIIDKSKKANEMSSSIADEIKKRTEQLIPQRNRANEDFVKADQAKKELANQIEQQDKQLSALNLSALRTERDTLKDLLRDIDTAESDVKAITTAVEAREEEAKRLTEVKESIEQQQKNLDEQRIPAYNAAKAKMDAAEQARNLLKDSVDSFAKQIRSRFTVGCECPVCRQTVKSLPLEDDIDQMYAAADDRFNKAKNAFNDAETDKNKAEANIKAEKKQYDSDKKKFDNDKSVETARSKATASCLKCGITTVDDATQQSLAALRQEKQKRLNDVLDPKISQGEGIEKVIKELREKQKSQTTDYENKRTAYDDAEKKVSDSEQTENNDKKILSGYQSEVQQARDNARTLIAAAQWQNDWTADPKAFKEELRQATKTYKEKVDRKSEVEVTIGPKQSYCDNIKGIISQILGIHDGWKDLAATKATSVKDLLTSANNVLQEVNSIHDTLKQANAKLTENTDKLNAFYAGHHELSAERLLELDKAESITSLSDELEATRQKPGQKKVLWEQAQKDHGSHQEYKPELAEEDTFESCNEAFTEADNKMTSLSQEIAVIDNDLRKDEQKKKGVKALQQKADEAREVYEKWNRINRLIGDKEGKTFRTIAQSYIFDGLLNAANTYLQKLEPRYTLKTIPGTLFSSLEDAYQGFASRDTSSLSGGESFLVSLALALALSDIGQGLSVDTLFIDEGFGSLSGRPLTNAINTLRSLRGKNGRHVGIISHIQEVRENIPVQIQVNKSANSSSSVIDITDS